jgi:crotonobetainyl-CoA:carnitine CoA-transferase CaiB-like acyl-CoA transferase
MARFHVFFCSARRSANSRANSSITFTGKGPATRRCTRRIGSVTAREHNFLIAPVATIDDVLRNPQFIARDYWQEIKQPEAAVTLRYPGPFARFSTKPIEYRRRPPAVGEHNHEVFVGDLGLSESEFRELARKGII